MFPCFTPRYLHLTPDRSLQRREIQGKALRGVSAPRGPALLLWSETCLQLFPPGFLGQSVEAAGIAGAGGERRVQRRAENSLCVRQGWNRLGWGQKSPRYPIHCRDCSSSGPLPSLFIPLYFSFFLLYFCLFISVCISVHFCLFISLYISVNLRLSLLI